MPRVASFFVRLSVGLILFGANMDAGSNAQAAAPDFARDVRPIFAAHCVKCHGAEKSQGGLRLDSSSGAFLPTDSGSPAIVPSKADESELLRRVTSEDEAERMPPEGDPLTVAEVDVLRRWIAEGAKWPEEKTAPKHWAWVAPQRPTPPAEGDAAQGKENWSKNAIDRFVSARLKQDGLEPSAEATPEALCRRLYLDLIGLPPTPADVAEFVAGYSHDDAQQREAAYAALVDKLLASPQFGERWARHWLDLARYADSNGFQRDGFRTMWAYRDWVVEAFNKDLPYDRFVIEQVAGDLLPDANDASRIATGFNRCTTVNVEAGTDPEENRVLAVVDRVNTTSTVFLGATIACAQCHNHKYDPFTQLDYYKLLAYFNSTEAEITPKGSARQFTGPSMPVGMTEPQLERQKQLTAELEKLEAEQAARAGEAAKLEETLTKQMTGGAKQPVERHVLPISAFESKGGATTVTLPDNSVLLTEDNPEKDVYTVTVHTQLTGITGFRLEALTDDSLPGKGPGRGDAERPNFVLNELIVRAAPKSGGASAKPVALLAGGSSFSQRGFEPAQTIDGDIEKGGWAINPKFSKPHWMELRTREPLGFAGGTVLKFELYQNYGGSRTIGRLRISALTGDVGGPELPPEVAAALQTPAAKRNKKQQKAVADYCLSLDPKMQELRTAAGEVRKQLDALKPPTTLVMVELDQPRSTALMKRGNFLDLGPAVRPGVPDSLHPLAKDAPSNRLGLAQWIVDPANPLMARVTVNRWWAELFGRGIVATLEDFGTQSEPPTHPELLDWLAVEFRASGLSMKQMLKLMVTSATYRQASRVTPELLEHDPDNRLLARGPRYRLPAETIRDNALAVAGLLSLKLGGPPVYPPQPEGIWRVTGEVDNRYYTSSGDDRYRRGLYTIWRRSAPYPSFVNFDAPDRSSCVVARPRTNTPLQALTLLNDPVYVEAAGALARRVVAEAPSEDENARAEFAVRLVLGRAAKPEETAELVRVYREEATRYAADGDKARKLLAAARIETGKRKKASPDMAELAAWYHVAEILLNLDETITRQ